MKKYTEDSLKCYLNLKTLSMRMHLRSWSLTLWKKEETGQISSSCTRLSRAYSTSFRIDVPIDMFWTNQRSYIEINQALHQQRYPAPLLFRSCHQPLEFTWPESSGLKQYRSVQEQSMWAERERQNFRSPLKPISVTPDPRSVPRSATSRSRSAPANFFHQVFGPLRSSPAPLLLQYVSSRKLKQEALLLQRNRATRYVSWNIMAVFWLSYWQEALLIQRNHASTL